MVDPTYTNLDFETAGATPGQASGWTIASVVTPFEVAEFAVAVGDSRGFEDFESDWGTVLFVFTDSDLEVAIFGVEDETETFDRIWGPFDGDAAEMFSNAVEPFALVDGQTLVLRVDGGAGQTTIFNTGDFVDIANATAAEVAVVINTDITGATANDASGRVRVISDTTGDGSTLQVDPSGTTATALDMPEAVEYPDYPERVASGFGDNSLYFTELSLLEAASFDSENFEDHEEQWGPFDGTNPDYPTRVGAGFFENSTFIFDFVGVGTDLEAASFDVTPEDFEDFEEDWRDNQNYKTDFVGVGTDLEAASFDPAVPEDVENFEQVIQYQIAYKILGAAAGRYSVFVSGVEHFYDAAGGDTTTTIRDALVTKINGSSQAVESAGITYAGCPTSLYVRSTTAPVTAHGFDYDAPNMSDVELAILDTTRYWTWDLFLRTLP